MKKIVFFDIDGTLLNTKGVLLDSTVKSIDKLRRNGVHVAVATGRAPYQTKEIIEKLKIDCYICFNGNYCVYDKKLIYKSPIKRNEIDWLLEIGVTERFTIDFYSAEKCVASDGILENRKFYFDIGLALPEVIPGYHLEKEIFDCTVSCDQNYSGQGIDKYREKFEVHSWHKNIYQVASKNHTKATGVKYMIEHLGYRYEDTYAFGDDINDPEMLRLVGTGVAMGNAKDVAKNAADFVTKHTDNDGIEHGLKVIGLI